MPWSHYLVRSVDKATVGEANQLMIRAGFRDASNYRSLMLKLKNAYANIVSDPKITFKQVYFTVESICTRFKVSTKTFLDGKQEL